MLTRRAFLETVAATSAFPAFRTQAKASEWGSDVFDLHFHLRPQVASNLTHLDGAGVTKANLDARRTTRSAQGARDCGAGSVHVVQQRRRHEA